MRALNISYGSIKEADEAGKRAFENLLKEGFREVPNYWDPPTLIYRRKNQDIEFIRCPNGYFIKIVSDPSEVDEIVKFLESEKMFRSKVLEESN